MRPSRQAEIVIGSNEGTRHPVPIAGSGPDQPT
jgi:hypothetical protein